LALKNQILTTVQPKIALKQMSMLDIDSRDFLKKEGDLVQSAKDSVGAIAPLVMIGEIRIDEECILDVTVRQDGFLPKLNITFYDKKAMFSTYHNPIFEPIISIYMKSQTVKLKPMRGDYLILSVKSGPIRNSIENIVTLECELYVPGLYDNVSKSYSNMSSMECLKEVAKELDLGFASNEDNTNDKMTWINPNMSPYMFVKDEVLRRSYKSDNSFFNCFIDRYYILNFINVEKQMAQDTEFDVNYVVNDIIASGGHFKGSDQREEDTAITSEIVLTNHPVLKKSVNHIKEFWPISNQGNILKNNSFRRRVIWYESQTEQVNSVFIEPLSNTRTLNGSVHQVPKLVDLKEMEVKKWMGLDTGNTHKHAKFAQMLNHHNLLELDKNLVGVRVNGINSVLMRGMRVPVVMYDEATVASLKSALEAKEDAPITASPNTYHVDKFMTDLYYIKDVVYKYDAFDKVSPLHTDLILSRRNWKKTLANNE
jgi:hypothetical protein